MQVIIDGRFVLDEADLHHRIAGALGYGPSPCRDIESLRERLASGDPRPVQLIWINASVIRMALGRARFEKFVATLETIESQESGRPWRERFVFRLFE
nr:barstar family protein [uncultured Actinoplanes sp.]